MKDFGFNCFIVLVNNCLEPTLGGAFDTYDDAERYCESLHYVGLRTNIRRGWKKTSKECMRTDICYPNSSHPAYRASLIYRADGTIR